MVASGGATNVYPFARATLLAGVTIATSDAPADRAGVVTTIVVAFLLTIVPEVPPKVTVDAFERFVPEMVTVVPPSVVPVMGDTEVIVAGAE